MISAAPVLSVTALCKTYAPRGKMPLKTALEGVSLDVPRGSMMALLGPNGAGKSTLINIIAGLVIKSAGTIQVDGIDLDTAPERLRQSVGVVPQEIVFDPFFTPRMMLDLQAGMFGVKATARRTDDLLAMMGLTDKADAPARSLSGGMKRRLMVAKALVHNPPLLILDEPTAGVDVELRQQLWTNIRALNQSGTTILLTTHYLKEAEELCDRIAILDRGRIIVDQPKNDLLQRIAAKDLILTLDRPIVIGDFTFGDGVEASILSDTRLRIRYAPDRIPVDPLLQTVRSSGYGIVDLVTEQSNLEDIFLQLTRHRDEKTHYSAEG